MMPTITADAALRALHSSDKREASEFIGQASGEISKRDAEIERLRDALDLAMKAACPDCAADVPTDKTWEHGNSDGIDRQGLYYPDRSSSGALGGGYHKCKAWEARAALSLNCDSEDGK